MKIESFIKQGIENPHTNDKKSSFTKFFIGWPLWLILGALNILIYYFTRTVNEILLTIWIILSLLHFFALTRRFKYGGLIQALGIWFFFLVPSMVYPFIFFNKDETFDPTLYFKINLIGLVVGLFFFMLIQHFFLGGLIYKNAIYHPRVLKKKYTKNSNGLAFSNKEYAAAAEALKKFHSTSYNSGAKKYGEKIMDILILSRSIAYVGSKKKLSRLVSLKSIEEDRAAGPNDE